ncbi:MAG: head-tail joining protein [Cypionkella sp.]
MASVFDGIGTALASVFGDDAVIMRKTTGLTETVQGVFRLMTFEDPLADGRDLLRQVPVFRMPANATTRLMRGDTVVPSNGGGKTYIVLDSETSSEMAADALTTYRLEELI